VPVALAERTSWPGVDRISGALSAWLYQAFLRRDVGVLAGMRLRPSLSLPQDEVLATFFDYLSTLPRLEPPG
jgi:hypothetical protein